MSTITIDLNPEEERQLEGFAAEHGRGTDTAALVKEILSAFIIGRGSAPSALGFDEVLAPFREGFAKSGMGQEETEAFLDAELEAVRAERCCYQSGGRNTS